MQRLKNKRFVIGNDIGKPKACRSLATF